MPLTGAAKIGRLHKLYVEPSADLATLPTWEEYGKIQGANRTGPARRGRGEGTRSRRHDRPVGAQEPRDYAARHPPSRQCTQYDYLEDAFENGTKIGIAMMTGEIATSGERGYQAEMYVTGFDDDQAHDSTSVQATLRPAADYTTAPDFVEIA